MLCGALVALGAPAANASPTPITSCDATTVYNDMVAGGDYVFQCSGNIFLPDTTIRSSGSLSLDATGQNVLLGRASSAFGKRFMEVSGGSVTLTNVTVASWSSFASTSSPIDGAFGVRGTNGVSGHPPLAPATIGNGTDGTPGTSGTDGGNGSDGGATQQGGAMRITGGSVTLSHVTFSGNQAGGQTGGNGGPGAIGGNGGSGGNAGNEGGNGGNGAAAGGGGNGGRGGDGASAEGGAIYNSGTLTINDSTFSGNTAAGGYGGFGGNGASGVIGGSGGNGATGGSGGNGGNGAAGGAPGNAGRAGNGGDARGGAIFNTGTLKLARVTFSGNSAKPGRGYIGGNNSFSFYGNDQPHGDGGYGGGGGTGGVGGVNGTSAASTNGGRSAVGGNSGNAYAGALFDTGTTTGSGDVFDSNAATAQDGGIGGSGGAGHHLSSHDNSASSAGSAGGNGGSADAGAFISPANLADSSICTGNTATAGAGGAGGKGGHDFSGGVPDGAAGPPGQSGTATNPQATCQGSSVSITSVRFRQHNVGTGKLEDAPSTGAVDGNQVQVVATVQNPNASDLTTDVSFGSPRDDSATVGATRAGVTIPAGSSRDVIEQLDTDGLAWNDGSHTAHSQRMIKVTLTDGTSQTATLVVRPKPVVLVHGLFSSAATWTAFRSLLAGANPLWGAYAVGDHLVSGEMNMDPFDSQAKTIAANAVQEAAYIDGVRRSADAAHVDVVAHSLGGLVSRYYVQQLMPGAPGDGRPTVSHLAMLGTPNLGSNCAYEALGLEALLLGKGVVTASNQPLLQLTPTYLQAFNAQVSQRRGVAFSALAGNGGPLRDCVSSAGVANDDLVSVPSAQFGVSDRSVEPLVHTEETSSPLAFEAWVKPHLALGPSEVGGGQYLGPVTARDGGTVAADRVGASALPSRLLARASATPRVCLAKTPAAAVLAGQTARVGPPSTMTFTVPPRSGRLDVVVLAQPTVSTALLDPRGHTTVSIGAGSVAAQGLFRTLTVSSPRSGKWRLRISAAKGSAASQVSASAQLGSSPLPLALSVSASIKKAKKKVLGTVLRFSAKIAVPRHNATASSVTLGLLFSGSRPLLLHLSALKGHPGSYAASTRALSSFAPAVVVATVKVPGSSVTSLLALSSPCK